ncbi:type II toxin-antitoxin system VapB family antitoxin [Pseudomonas sp. NA-150]|uniref:type II toxin-antitoxin system VapB family antitoxin n=1 Tax=Pseudomonas sp. NA-150 TaxID=3367525 RepID=UPI0037C5D19A
MKITHTIENALFEKAMELASPDTGKADLIREALETFVRVQAAKRLMAQGGTVPRMSDIEHRR